MSATLKGAISQRFIRASAKEVEKVLNCRFDEETFLVPMIERIGFGDYTAIVATGVIRVGHTIIMAPCISSTENAQVRRDLLTDLVHRRSIVMKTTYWL